MLWKRRVGIPRKAGLCFRRSCLARAPASLAHVTCYTHSTETSLLFEASLVQQNPKEHLAALLLVSSDALSKAISLSAKPARRYRQQHGPLIVLYTVLLVSSIPSLRRFEIVTVVDVERGHLGRAG